MEELVKEKVGDFEDEVREGFYMWMRKELTDFLKGVSGKRRFLVRFQGGSDKYLILNQHTILIVFSNPVTKEAEVPTIYVITEGDIDL